MRMTPFTLAPFMGLLGILPSMGDAGEAGRLVSQAQALSDKDFEKSRKLARDLEAKTSESTEEAAQILGALSKEKGVLQTGTGHPHKAQKSSFGKVFPHSNDVESVRLPHEGKGNCGTKTSPGSGKCGSSLFQSRQGRDTDLFPDKTQLIVFVSQSVPTESLKVLYQQVHKLNGKLVMRGLIGGSFQKTRSYVQDSGIVVDIDPVKFDEFGVTQVPAFVLSKGKHQDKMTGNISLKAFLEESAQGGDLKEESRILLKKLQGEES